MKNELKKLVELIAQDYANWTAKSAYGDDDTKAERANDFMRTLHVEEGRKYMKVIQAGSVWGFVMKADDKQFKAGDILKAASWAAPARNKPRGNILEGDFSWVRWTGPEYL